MDLFSLFPYQNQKICVALSGGVDSVCLLHYFFFHAEEYNIALSALTCEHGIRGEASLSDLAFTRALCADRKIPLRVFRFDAPAYAKENKLGIEEAARELRYRCFQTAIEEDGVTIATAHHEDDLAETVLFRLCRGASLAGMNVFPVRERIVRPFSFVTRVQILQYARVNGLQYVTDESNFDETYTRNFLRCSILAPLNEAIPSATKNIAAFARRAAADDEYLQSLAKREIKEEDGGFHIPADLPPPLFFRACVYALKSLGVRKDYTAKNLEEAFDLKNLQTGRKICLPCGVEAVKEYDEIIIFRPAEPFSGEIPFQEGVLRMGEYQLEIGEGTKENSLSADLNAFPAGCVIRTRRAGDEFVPFGGRKKTLKKFFTDKKISSRTGNALPLIACGSEIYAIFGVEISDKVRLTDDTKRAGYLYTPQRAANVSLKCKRSE